MSIIFVDESLTEEMFAGKNAAIVTEQFSDGLVFEYAFVEEAGNYYMVARTL